MVLRWRRNLWVLTGGATMASSSYTMVTPFLPLYLQDIGAAPEDVAMWSGLVFSVTFLVAAILAPYWGRQADKSGKRRMLLRAGYSLAITYFMGAFVTGPGDLFIVRALQGVANGFIPAAMALTASTSPPDQLGFSLGIIQTGMLTGSIIGPLIGGTLSHLIGMRSSFVVAAILIGLGTTVVHALAWEPKTSRNGQVSSIADDFKMALRNRRLIEMLLLLYGVQVVAMALQPVIALFIGDLQGQSEGIVLAAGIVLSLAGIAGAIAAPIWGRIGQVRGFPQILMFAFTGAGVFNLAQFFANDIWQFGFLQFFYGLFIVGVYPSINTIAVSSVDANAKGRVFGLTTTANMMGSMTGPLIGGFISTWLSNRTVFLAAGCMLLFLGATVFFTKLSKQKSSASILSEETP